MRAIRNEHRRKNYPCSERKSTSRPIALDLHTRRNRFADEYDNNRQVHYNKENHSRLPHWQERTHRQPIVTTCHSRNRLFEPIDLDILSSPSSLSDEFLRDADSAEFDQELVDLDADYSPTAAMVSGADGRAAWRAEGSRRPISFYSTSDLTTSDSEIHCHRQKWRSGGRPYAPHTADWKWDGVVAKSKHHSPDFELRERKGLKRTNRLSLAKRFPSLSTIYPDNSSFSLGEGDIELEVTRADESIDTSSAHNDVHRQLRRQRKTKIRHGSEENLTLHELLNGNRRKQPTTAINCILDIDAPVAIQPPSLMRNINTHVVEGRAGGLEMIKEISPVLPPLPHFRATANEHDSDLPPVIQPLQMSREWRPIQTSTMTNFFSEQTGLTRMPKTNPRRNPPFATPTPHSTPRHHADPATSNVPPLRSLFEPGSRRNADHDIEPVEEIRPENFNLPSQLAKHCSIKGILFLDVRLQGWAMIVAVKNAAYFHLNHSNDSLNRGGVVASNSRPVCATRNPCSYVKVEIRKNRSLGRKRNVKHDSRFKSARTCVAVDTNRPEFYEEFKFRITSSHLKFGDKLLITVYYSTGDIETNCPDYAPRDVLGKMSFSLRKLYRKAQKLNDNPYPEEPIKVCDGGYFLLPERTGSEGHLSQDNILHRKYYDEIGSSMSTASSSMQSAGSPLKMMGEPSWPGQVGAHQHGYGLTAGSVPSAANQQISGEAPVDAGFAQSNDHVGLSRNAHIVNGGMHSLGNSPARSATTGQSKFLVTSKTFFNELMPGGKPPRKISFGGQANRCTETTSGDGDSTHPLDYTTTGSSSSNSGIDYKRRHRSTLPSITTTTTDTTTSDFCTEEMLVVRDFDRQANPKTHNNENIDRDSRVDFKLLHPNSPAPSNTIDSHCSEVKKPSPGKDGVRRVASFTFSPEGSSDKLNRRGLDNTSRGRKFTLGSLGKTFNFIRHKVDMAISTSTLHPTKEECRQWQDSFESLLKHKCESHPLYRHFARFIKLEWSSENLEFWLECEEFKKMKEGKRITVQKAHSIYDTYVMDGAVKEVNLDSATKAATRLALESEITPNIFNMAQGRIEQLMAKDSYQRFLKSDCYLELLRDDGDLSYQPAPSENQDPTIVRSASAKEPSRKFSTNDSGTKISNELRRHTCVPENDK